MRYAMNDYWYFTKKYTDSLKALTPQEVRGSGFECVRIPHTVQLMEQNCLLEEAYQMESGYFYLLYAREEWMGKQVHLTFGAAAHEAEVFLNGKSLYTHRCGYTAFRVDLSQDLVFGKENVIAVRLDSRESLNIPPFGNAIDYMTFGGLYRNITLEVKEQSSMEEVFIYGDQNKKLVVQLKGHEAEGCSLDLQVRNMDGTIIKEIKELKFQEKLETEVPEATLWSVESPNLYLVRLELKRDGKLQDQKEIRTGFRTVEFLADGFYLNGDKIKLRGLNRHQSWPYMGYAVPDRAQALDADILKNELGCNAVRTSHYPQSHAFINRCDELGLLVFTEMPGWQHIGNDNWKKQAIENTREMIVEYRNHPSIFLWGVRINESIDDDLFYQRTNEVAHKLDPSRPTGGVRNFKKSHLLEDVYTYNDFYHNGTNQGVEPKKKVTSDMAKGYLVSEYNGHMFPTKPGDWEGKRRDHALRHAAVIETVAKETDIGGSFGWCMFDYNTHQDFGSGDHVCYHGVMDMFRNQKMASAVYAAEGCKTPVLCISSSMDIGEHPAGYLGNVYAFTNADSVRLYKNNQFIKEFYPGKPYQHMQHPPIYIDDMIGGLLEEKEGMSHRTAKEVKKCLQAVAQYGPTALPPKIIALAAKLMIINRFTYEQATQLFGKYIASWGEKATSWRFEARKGNETVAEVIKEPIQQMRLEVQVDTRELEEADTWDMATIRIRVVDQNGNVIPYTNRAVKLKVEGAAALIGPDIITFSGGMTGAYVKTIGCTGNAVLSISVSGMEEVSVRFEIVKRGSCNANDNETEGELWNWSSR